MSSDKGFVIVWFASFIASLAFILLSNKNYIFLLIYAALIPSLLDHIKSLR